MKKVILILVMLCILTAMAFVGTQYVLEKLPTKEKASLHEIFPYYQKGMITVVMGEENIDPAHGPKVHEGIIYLPVDLINTYIDPYYYWDKEESTLTYTTKEQVIRMDSEELEYFVNSEPLTLDMPIMTFGTDMAYVPMTIIQEFSDVVYSYNQDQEILILDTEVMGQTYGKSMVMKEEGIVRISPDIKGKVAKILLKNEALRVYQEDKTKEWLWVRTESGILGYIQRKQLGTISEISTPVKPVETEEPGDIQTEIEGKLNIGWHYMYNASGNSKIQDKLEISKGLDVISPTWFSLKDSEGNISNKASKEYVAYAKSKGVAVWALFSNDFNKSRTHNVLSSTKKREQVIKQILAMVSIYDLDGINIDFESVAKEDGEYYVQFIREITAYLKAEGVIVSVDMYVPSAWTAHYNRTELGKVVDYLIIMAYDEHWGSSPKSGSVASIGFVEKGILGTLAEVPKEKVILGMPYYTRRWKEVTVDGKVEVSSKAYSMNKAKRTLEEAGATIKWLDDTGQYYGEYEEDGNRYRIWLEEERSIEEKLKLMEDYELAGVAGWRLGFEKPEIWDLLKTYLRKE